MRYFDTLAGRLTGIPVGRGATAEGQRYILLQWPAAVSIKTEPIDGGKEFLVKTVFEPLPFLGKSKQYMLYVNRVCGETILQDEVLMRAYSSLVMGYKAGVYDLGPMRAGTEATHTPAQGENPEGTAGVIATDPAQFPIVDCKTCERNDVGDIVSISPDCEIHSPLMQSAPPA